MSISSTSKATKNSEKNHYNSLKNSYRGPFTSTQFPSIGIKLVALTKALLSKQLISDQVDFGEAESFCSRTSAHTSLSFLDVAKTSKKYFKVL